MQRRSIYIIMVVSLLLMFAVGAKAQSETVREPGLNISEAGEPLQVVRHTPREKKPEGLQLSGPVETYETEHFRIHYTQSGADKARLDYVMQVADALEATWSMQIDTLGWPAPPPQPGGNGRYPVYIANLKERDGTLMGYVRSVEIIGDNPNSAIEEEWGTRSFMAIENDFAEMRGGAGHPLELMRATVAHEFHHAVQYGYDISDEHDWYYEATSTWMEVVTFDLGRSAIGYIDDTFYYPEICFGAPEVDGYNLYYGYWTFIQTLADRHGPQFVLDMWDEIAFTEGFEPLEETLAAYDDTLPDAVLQYHLRNVARDYHSIEYSRTTLWLANTITEDGLWQSMGPGVQHLGANFFYLKRPPGIYQVEMDDYSDGDLSLWSIGVRNGQLEATELYRGSQVSTMDYDYVYLMVFNEAYDNWVTSCDFTDYELYITTVEGTPATPDFILDAPDFLPLS